MSERKTGYRGQWKKWLLIYLAVGIVVYALVYFVFFSHGGGSGSGGLYSVLTLPFLGAGAGSRR